MGTIVPGETDSGQFAVVAGKDRCSGKTIKPGKSCTFQVSFLPSLPNTRAGTITIPSNDPASPMTIQLTGVGIPDIRNRELSQIIEALRWNRGAFQLDLRSGS